MPELPEAEVNRENLERWLKGNRVAAVRVLDRLMLRGQDPRRLESALRGARLREARRRAKYLVLDFGPRGSVLAHLGMTGKYRLREKGEEPPRGARVALELAGGRRVDFVDQRRFGTFQLLDRAGEEMLAGLGIEPLSKEFTPARLRGLLGKSRLPVKLFLMDQTRLAGLGNIHAAEALFLARIDPRRTAGRLSPEAVRRLHRAIRKSLAEAIRKARGPEVAYVEEDPSANVFRVYGREGQPCPRCGRKLERLAQGGRSTFYCPGCQRG